MSKASLVSNEFEKGEFEIDFREDYLGPFVWLELQRQSHKTVYLFLNLVIEISISFHESRFH